MNLELKKIKLTIIGMGYVGLPLAINFGKKINTFGFDNSRLRINFLKKKIDNNNEFKKKDFLLSKNVLFTNDPSVISNSDFIVVTVPTPINGNNKPDFTALLNACKNIGKYLKKKSTIIFESTVYPGATRDICIPAIERHSKKKWKKDFFIGYSPERANVGDRSKSVTKVKKIISGDCFSTLLKIRYLYKIITKKLYEVSSVEVAEAAKSIENIQRDVNISLMNEFSIICNKVGINTREVLDAASTKWNFCKFLPGLVGGHCISVDPYYLIHKSKSLGYLPKLMTTSREVNESLPYFLFDKIKKIIKKNNKRPKKFKILILGLTFKENCRDIRNSKIFILIKLLKRIQVNLTLNDPYALKEEVLKIYNENATNWNDISSFYDMIILVNPHKYYLELGLKKILTKLKFRGYFLDIKSFFNKELIESKKNEYLSL